MKKIIPWMLATAVIMLVFPWLAVTFIKGDGGMAACFILFFAVNPIYAICSGARAGKDIKKLWIPGCGYGEGCGGPDWLHSDHRPQLVQPRVAESFLEGAEVLHSKDLSR